MAIEIKVPEVGESIREVEIGAWLKKKGDAVGKDEPVVALESDKATVEVYSPMAGTITELLKRKGEVAKVGETIAYMESGTVSGTGASTTKAGEAKSAGSTEAKATAPAEIKPAAPSNSGRPSSTDEPRIMPAAQRALAQANLKPEDVKGTGPGGRILKEDVQRQEREPARTAAPSLEAEKLRETRPSTGPREEELVPMTKLRRTLAERLVQVQQTAAMLTTFNEVDMSGVMGLRKEFGETFQQKYNVKLGFMSFFVKAVIEGLKSFPEVNAEIRGTDIIYRNYFDIGVAIGGGKGLVVPVLRNTERLSFAEVELAIGEFAKRARENKLKPDELQGGTFTISNGGVYGSLLSTPILNPPQSGILGMHTIQERPVAREGQVVIRPMMYVALTYDHRLVDGREAVGFLKKIKDIVEAPARMLLEI